jgi:hypothetical protein
MQNNDYMFIHSWITQYTITKFPPLFFLKLRIPSFLFVYLSFLWVCHFIPQYSVIIEQFLSICETHWFLYFLGGILSGESRLAELWLAWCFGGCVARGLMCSGQEEESPWKFHYISWISYFHLGRAYPLVIFRKVVMRFFFVFFLLYLKKNVFILQWHLLTV